MAIEKSVGERKKSTTTKKHNTRHKQNKANGAMSLAVSANDAMLSRQEYNVNELEMSIDHLRQQRDWPAVSALIKRYAHVFDIGYATEGGSRSRAYYWVVMAEVMIYHSKDIQNAGFCITRSAERDPDFGVWRIVLVKILLIRTKNLANKEEPEVISALGSDAESETAFPGQINRKLTTAPSSGGIQTDAYDKAIQQLDEHEEKQILSFLEGFKMSHRKAILSSFSSLPSDEILRIFMEVLVLFNQGMLDHNSSSARNQFIYIICKKVLQNIHITDYYQQYLDKLLSEYNFWMVLDAISTRSLIREMRGEMQQARSDLQQLVHVVVKQYSHSLSTLPVSIRTSLLFTCCRLPILERDMNLHSAALTSFHFCVSADSFIAPHLSEPVKIVLCMAAADMMLQVAHKQGEEVGQLGQNSGERMNEHREEDTGHEESIDDIVNHAYMVLVHAKEMLSGASPTCSVGGRLVDANTDFIAHHPSSLINDLKDRLGDEYTYICRSDPVSLFEASPTGAVATEHVSILLASITRFQEGKKINVQDPLSVLTWAMSASVRPSYDLLWNISQMYLSPHVNRIDESVCLMRQCVERKAVTTRTEELQTIFDRGELSTWLGLGVQVHKYPAMPALKCAQACLYGLGNPKRAIDAAFHGLGLCAGAGGIECAELVQRRLLDTSESGAEGSMAPLNKHMLTLSLMSSLGSTAVNIFEFVLMIAKSFAALSRCTHAGDSQVQQWVRKSSMLFDLLESTELRDLFDSLQVSDQDDWSFEDLYYEECRHQALASFVLESCAFHAERGEISFPIKRLKSFLDEVEGIAHCDTSRHYSLLIVLLSCAHDGPDIPEHMISKVIPVESECPLLLASSKLTLSQLYCKESKLEEASALAESVSKLVLSRNGASPEYSTKLSHLDKQLSVYFPFQEELLKIHLLLGCSLVHRSSNNYDRAQYCVEEAWSIFQSPTLAQAVYPTSTVEQGLSPPADVPSSQPRSDEANMLSAGRRKNILQGWRLPSGMGWGLAETFTEGRVGNSHEDLCDFAVTRRKYSSVQADLLAESANVLYCRVNQDVFDCHSAVEELIAQALALEPNHLESNLLMSQLHADLAEAKDPSARSVGDVLRAVECARICLKQDEKSAGAW